MNSARKAKCQRTHSIPSTVRSPAVDSLQKVAQEGWIFGEAQHYVLIPPLKLHVQAQTVAIEHRQRYLFMPPVGYKLGLAYL